MYRIAIVEDDRSFVEELQTYLGQYALEEKQRFPNTSKLSKTTTQCSV